MRSVAGAVVLVTLAAGCAFAGGPEKQTGSAGGPDKQAGPHKQAGPGKQAGSEKHSGSSGYPAKKCPHTTQECLNTMAAKMKVAGWIGIEYDPEKDYVITRVVPGSPGEKAGLLPGDQLAALNGVEIREENESALLAARKKWTPGQVVHYTIKRNGLARQVDITLGEWPADLLARYIGEHMLQHAEADAAAPSPK
jgi:membrane-associated protease RseP (regulator of RpoE activity)